MHKSEQLNHELQKKLSILLVSKMKNKNLRNVVIIDTVVDKNFSYAKIYYTILNNNVSQSKIEKDIKNALGFIRTSVAQYFKTKKIPELKFIYDKNFDSALRIDKILDDLKEKNKI